jgi:hypothetical protein
MPGVYHSIAHPLHMSHLFFVILVLSLSLVSCGKPSVDDVVATNGAQTASVLKTFIPTATFTPTITPTPLPISTPTPTPVPGQTREYPASINFSLAIGNLTITVIKVIKPADQIIQTDPNVTMMGAVPISPEGQEYLRVDVKAICIVSPDLCPDIFGRLKILAGDGTISNYRYQYYDGKNNPDVWTVYFSVMTGDDNLILVYHDDLLGDYYFALK